MVDPGSQVFPFLKHQKVTSNVPALFGVMSWLTYGAGNVRLDDSKLDPKPKFLCILPVYNEELVLLVTGIQSILESNYPKELIEVHVSIDDQDMSPLYKGLVKSFDPDVVPQDLATSWKHVTSEGSIIYVHRWPHGGKRSAQAYTWNYIQNETKVPENAIMILTDSDNFMLSEAINNLAVEMHRYPKKAAFAEYMSCFSKAEKWYNFNTMRLLQDTEYVTNEINRCFELSMGTVNCLPGGFTAIRYSALAKLAPNYFIDLQPKSITQYHQFVLGEDRYLSHLAHKTLPAGSVGFCPKARCKTDPPDTAMKYVKQRRRWLLGSISNEAYMLSTPMLWRKFPVLLTFKVIQNSWRSTNFCQILVAVSAIYQLSSSSSDAVKIYLVSVLVPFCAAWIAGTLAGIALGRFKIFFCWPFMIIAQNVLQIAIDWYTIYTWRLKSWGGPRFTTVESESMTEVLVENVIEVSEIVDESSTIRGSLSSDSRCDLSNDLSEGEELAGSLVIPKD